MPILNPKSLDLAAAELQNGNLTSRELTESCLTNIEDSHGQGASAFRVVNKTQALASSDRIDAARRAEKTLPKYAGVPIAIKDLFDVAGEQTLAGSQVLNEEPPARQDCTVVARLRDAGFIILGRTNMTEFAYSGLGLNPHYGTPLNPWDRNARRIPGGSSSGAAVAVADGMALAGLGTDTGGSCRIPAAMCGIVGFKPTQRRVSLQGVTPLSSSLDSVGPLANSAGCCAALDKILSDDLNDDDDINITSVRIAVLRNFVFDDIENEVANGFEAALATLSESGVSVSDITIPALNELPEINSKGGFAAAEAFAWHETWLKARESAYDPRVSVRIKVGEKQTAVDYIKLLQHRQRLIEAAHAEGNAYDAIVYPTVPIVAPTIESLLDDEEYARTNLLALRNPSVTNFLDRCAISIPVGPAGEAPIGMNVMGRAMDDRRILNIAQEFERIFDATRRQQRAS